MAPLRIELSYLGLVVAWVLSSSSAVAKQTPTAFVLPSAAHRSHSQQQHRRLWLGSQLKATIYKEDGKPQSPQFQQPIYRPNSKFPQPAFGSSRTQQSTENNKNNGDHELTKRRKNANHKRKFGGDSRLASRHKQRLKMAGREGTKRYQNPNKVFLGNLAFNLTSSDLEAWLSDQFSIPAPLLLKQCKVIQDWKTQTSKGYGFAVFTEPVYATVCLEKCHNQEILGRKLNVKPGYKKQPNPAVYLEQKRQKARDREEAAIQAGIDLAELDSPPKPKMDPIEAQLLRHLDPDLVDDNDVEVFEFKNEDMSEEDLLDDVDLFDESGGDSDNEGVDGFWTEEDDYEDMPLDDEHGLPMNRARRREAARKRKKKKPTNKGFG